VKSIGVRAFHNGTSLISVTIPYSVTSIANDAFTNCTNALFYVKSDTIKSLLISCGVRKSIILENLKGMILNKTSLNLGKGSIETLAAVVTPTNEINWSSSNSDVATVDSNGNVAAVGVGTATIICISNDENRSSATCTVTVTYNDAVAPTLGSNQHLSGKRSVEDPKKITTIAWMKATDDKTPQSNLRYYLYQADRSYLEDIKMWESNATLINEGGSLDIDSIDLSGIDSKKGNYFKLIVADEANNKTPYNTTIIPLQ
jgi:hypothetical protein